jgi:O-antigen/teichoic acid export membrane protein
VGKNPGLRANLLWTLAGNFIYGVCQWAILSLIAKLGNAEMLGRYALAVSIAGPPMMFAHLNLRAVLATDAVHHHSFSDYIVVRHSASAVAMLVIIGLSLLSGDPMVTLLVGISLGAENLSDLYFGALQRRERMNTIAVSMMLRGLGSAVAVAIALLSTGSIVLAVAALVVVRILLLMCYDRPISSRGEQNHPPRRESQWQIVRNALPLGAVLMLISLTTNLPRYSIERRLGMEELGAFAAVASFLSIGYLVTNALGQSVMPRLARLYQSHDLRRFRRLAAGSVAIGAAVGLAGVSLASTLGPLVLARLYRPEYASFAPVLVATMAASVALYSAATLGYINTSTRAFHAQLPMFGVSALVCGVSSEILVPRYGLIGAPMALASAAGVQIIGHVLIVRRMTRRLLP